MEKKIETLKAFFEADDYRPLTAKQIAAIFAVPKSEKVKLEKLLDLLEVEGYLYKDDSKRYQAAKRSNMYKCKFEAKSKGFGFASYISEISEQQKDIYISKENSLNAMNGDIVLVSIYKNATKDARAEGKIVKILTRNTTVVVGKFEHNKTFGFVVCDDNKIAKDIYIPKKYINSAKTNDKVVCEIMKFPEGIKKAEGKVLEVLGNAEDPFVDILSIFKAYEVTDKFNVETLKEADALPDHVTKEDKKNRKIVDQDKIITIDGEDAKDLDDAVYVEKLENGNFFLSVHIADVSHYVKEGGAIDKEAFRRGTSIYVPGKVLPMLPKKLSNGICSLNENVERCAMTCDMYIDKEGNIYDSEVYKSVITVKHRMNYTDVYKMICGDKELIKKYQDVYEEIMNMKELAEILIKARHDEGAIDFNMEEAKITIDENGNVSSVEPYKITIANRIIEQFMLSANMTVAEKMFYFEAPFVYRIHEKPDDEKLTKLNSVLTLFNKRLKGIQNIHPKEMQKILDEITDEKEYRIISTLMLRSLKMAKYSHENLGHFGLSAEFYCHFTSPIRRYPDLFIHRVISKYIEDNYVVADHKLSKLYDKAIVAAKVSSDAEKKATEIERLADDMYKAKYMEDKVGEEYDGVISSVTSFGFFVELENTVEGLVQIASLKDDYYSYMDEKFMLVGMHTGKQYKLGDDVRVRVVRADSQTKQVDFEII